MTMPISKPSSKTKNKTAWFVGTFVGLLGLGNIAQADPVQDVADGFTHDLAPHIAPCTAPAKLGIWPIDYKTQPISPAAAQTLYDTLMAHLIAGAGDCIDVMDGAGIGVVLSYLHQTGALRDAGGNPVAALEAANQDVDIVALPQLTVRSGRVTLAIKAVRRETGETLVQTPAVSLSDNMTTSAMIDTARDLDVALSDAAKQLAAQAPDLSRIVPAGVFYQGSGVQPEFGRYFQDRLVSELVDKAANLLTGKALQVVAPEFDLSQTLGESLRARDLDPLARISDRDGADGLYQMRGTYWVFDDVIDITMTLKDTTGRSASWQSRLKRADLGPLSVMPANPDLGDRSETTENFAVLMTSPKGSDPVFHPGEELVAYVRSDRRVWLYCFYIDALGDVTQVLPNMFRKDFAQGHMLTPFVLHALPDPRKDPFRFRINADTLGEERLKCLATTRNVSDDLPEVLRGTSFDPIPQSTAANIDTIFQQLPNTQLASTSLTISIAPKGPEAD
ncbi:DUF4384 domain-containing protein [uncultured Pelagimonas sp.]|uniref:DUF4384 domain-containing protein n=1 Tax=uncultured Pelagimonas sp. TaxID=1618102 RepID=UPI002630EAC1|nr:DUF4384 domain-containing protein [uncultured Pelagimonas sp.]